MPRIAIGAEELAALHAGGEEIVAAHVGDEQVYDKSEEEGCECTPAWVTGNRTGSITVAQTMGSPNGAPNELVDGVTTGSSGLWISPDGTAVAGKGWEFDFGAAAVKITGARSVNDQLSATTKGIHKWQGWTGSAWEDVGDGSTFEWVRGDGGTPTDITGNLASNTKGYTKYRTLGITGNWRHLFINEIEFLQCTCP